VAKKSIPKKRVLEGVVISSKMEKTIVVKIKRKYLYPVYRKDVTKFKKFKVHDPQKRAKVGDTVRIIESRPYSKDKHFRLLDVIR